MIAPNCSDSTNLRLCTKSRCLTVTRKIGVQVNTPQYRYCRKKMKQNAVSRPRTLSASPFALACAAACLAACAFACLHSSQIGDSGVLRATQKRMKNGNAPIMNNTRQPWPARPP